MAVTKIHRTSRIVLYITIAISIVITAIVLFGGQTPEGQRLVGDGFEPKFLDSMLYWMYVLLAITVAVLLVFAVIDVTKSFAINRKKALMSILAFVALAGLLLVTYLLGDGTILNITGYDGSDNNPVGLKLADMSLFSIYILFSLTILALLVSPLLKKLWK